MITRKDKLVICYIQAFDCEKTITKAMNSVLQQTYKNWYCFVLSNGNNNNHTFDEIRNFAARDSRFVVLNKKHNSLDMYIPSLYHLASVFPDAFICSLDSDDEYENDFFERAVSFAETNQLDIVACGTQMIRKKDIEATEETVFRTRVIKENLIIRGEDFSRKFVVYRSYFNEIWGKLYRASLFTGKDWDYIEKIIYGRFLPDTLFIIDTLAECTAIGILSGHSHKFYHFVHRPATSATNMVNAAAANKQPTEGYSRITRRAYPENKFSVYHTYDVIMKFIEAHGELQEETYEYMQAVLLGWFYDLYNRTLLVTTDEEKLSEHVRLLLSNQKFDELMAYRGTGRYNNLKDYQDRIDFCLRLRNMLSYQPAIRNREEDNVIHLECTAETNLKILKSILKLEQTIQRLVQLQEEIGYPSA